MDFTDTVFLEKIFMNIIGIIGFCKNSSSLHEDSAYSLKAVIRRIEKIKVQRSPL